MSRSAENGTYVAALVLLVLLSLGLSALDAACRPACGEVVRPIRDGSELRDLATACGPQADPVVRWSNGEPWLVCECDA